MEKRSSWNTQQSRDKTKPQITQIWANLKLYLILLEVYETYVSCFIISIPIKKLHPVAGFPDILIL